MYDIIVGAGRLGLELAKYLIKAGHEVVIIEKDKERCNAIASEINALVINGDATKATTLQEAGVKSADNFLAVSGIPEANLLACLLAKNMGAKRTIARVSDPESEEVFKSLGIDAVVNPEVAAATYIEKLVMRPGVLDLVVIGRGNAEILEIEIPKGSGVVGKTIREIGPPKNYTIIAVVEDDSLIIPSGDTVLREGDRVLVLARIEAIPTLEKLFGKKLIGK